MLNRFSASLRNEKLVQRLVFNKENILPLNIKILWEEIFINYFIFYFSHFVLAKILHFLFLLRSEHVIFISSWSYSLLLLAGRSPSGFLSCVVFAPSLAKKNSVVFLFSPLLQISGSHFSQQSIFLSIETPLYHLPRCCFLQEVLGNDTATLLAWCLKQEWIDLEEVSFHACSWCHLPVWCVK